MERRVATGNFSIYMLIIFLAFLFVQNPHAAPNSTLQLLTPLPGTAQDTQGQPSQEKPEPYINRSGEVSLDAAEVFRDEFILSIEQSSERKSFRGAQLSMSFFPEKEITVIIDSESRPQSDVISLSGYTAGGDISTFSMTITKDRYLITFHDLDNGIKYRVVGDVETGVGKVVEVDLAKLPPVYDTKPLILPED